MFYYFTPNSFLKTLERPKTEIEPREYKLRNQNRNESTKQKLKNSNKKLTKFVNTRNKSLGTKNQQNKIKTVRFNFCLRSLLESCALLGCVLNPLQAKWPMEPALISGFFSVKRIRVFDSPWMGH